MKIIIDRMHGDQKKTEITNAAAADSSQTKHEAETAPSDPLQQNGRTSPTVGVPAPRPRGLPAVARVGGPTPTVRVVQSAAGVSTSG